jgi:putative addiction module antidote
MLIVKLITVGSSIGIIVPAELLERMHVKEGDMLYVTETENSIKLTPCEPNLAQQMEAAERVMREDSQALHELAN